MYFGSGQAADLKVVDVKLMPTPTTDTAAGATTAGDTAAAGAATPAKRLAPGRGATAGCANNSATRSNSMQPTRPGSAPKSWYWPRTSTSNLSESNCEESETSPWSPAYNKPGFDRPGTRRNPDVPSVRSVSVSPREARCPPLNLRN